MLYFFSVTRPRGGHPEVVILLSNSLTGRRLTSCFRYLAMPPPVGTIRLVISESNLMGCELLRRGLARARGIQVVSTALTVSELSAAVVTHRPDIALVSAHLQDGPYSGFKILRQVKNFQTPTRVIVLVDSVEREVVLDAFRAGARGVFHRSAPLNSLHRCINAVHHGQIWASSMQLEQLLEAFGAAVPFRCVNSQGRNLLTAREQQLLPLVAEGRSNAEIAAALNVSEHTVKNHLFHIYEKLGISTRVELVLYAISGGENPAAA
jgi:DNA-binding NarL/FixJ family response regulator